MANKKYLFQITIMIIVLLNLGCSSFEPFIYNSQTPMSEQCGLDIGFNYNIKSFDGNEVNWSGNSLTKNKIYIPSGMHTIVYYYDNRTSSSSSSSKQYYSAGTITTVTKTTTYSSGSKSADRSITMDFKSPYWYYLSSDGITSTSKIIDSALPDNNGTILSFSVSEIIKNSFLRKDTVRKVWISTNGKTENYDIDKKLICKVQNGVIKISVNITFDEGDHLWTGRTKDIIIESNGGIYYFDIKEEMTQNGHVNPSITLMNM